MSGEQFRVLVIEELTACDATWSDAAESMRQEALAMLQAVLCDLQQVPGCRTQVLLSTTVAGLWHEQNLPAGEVQVLENSTGVGEWLEQVAEQGPECDCVLMIAPEADGLLLRRLQQLNTGHWQSISTLNCCVEAARIFTDKHQTAGWLRERGIPAIPGVIVADAVVQQLLLPQEVIGSAEVQSDSCSAAADTADSASVIKPRDGAGCEAIRQLPQGFDVLKSLGDAGAGAVGEWLLQPFINGQFCSAAIVGRRDGQRLILPAGEQRIAWQNQRPVYLGGRIPVEPLAGQAIAVVMQQIATALPVFAGWIGVDVVVSRANSEGPQVQVVEINPRFCTSFAGYRRVSDFSLLEWMLTDSAAASAMNLGSLFPGQVRFLADGSVLSS